MMIVNKHIPQARGLAGALLKRAAQLELDWDTRSKSRFDASDSSGRALGIFLPRGTVLRGGDVLVAEDGSLIIVKAAAQAVLVVRHCAEHGAPFDLLRAAYHLGNRHVQLELQADRLQLEPDHVLADLLRSMHLIVSEEQAAFEPEAGAYAAAQAHGPGPGHEQGHAHAHAQDPTHQPAASKPVNIPIKAAAAPHVHGPGCGHDHGHGH